MHSSSQVSHVAQTQASSRLPARAATAPGAGEVTAIQALALATTIGTIQILSGFWQRIPGYQDNPFHAAIASAILRWDFAGLSAWHFWGYPYAMALVSAVTGISVVQALVAVSVPAALVAARLAQKLWGGWVAAYFAILNFHWLIRAGTGGAEPLFLALLFGGFLAARRRAWRLAALLISLSATARPMAVFALAGIALELFREKRLRSLAAPALVSGTIAALYVIPQWLAFRDPMLNVTRYSAAAWPHEWPIGLPFVALVKWALRDKVDLHKALISASWVVFMAASSVASLLNAEFRRYCAKHVVEATFAALYVVLLFGYNSKFAWSEFVRFAIPVLPFTLLGIERRLPKRRSVVWTIAAVSGVLAGVSASIGTRSFVRLVLGI